MPHLIGGGGLRRSTAVAVTAALALLSASVAGAVAVPGQGEDAAPGGRLDPSGIVLQASDVTVSGRVTDVSGSGLGDVSLVLTHLGTTWGGWSSYEAVTDANGSYSIGPFDPGRFYNPGRFYIGGDGGQFVLRVSAPDDGYVDTMVPFVVESAAPIRLDDIRLGPGGTVTGRVAEHLGEAIETRVGLCLDAASMFEDWAWWIGIASWRSSSWRSSRFCDAVESDASGDFEFRDVAAGTYFVTAEGRYVLEVSVTLDNGGHERVDLVEVVTWDYEFEGAFFDDEGTTHEAAINALARRWILRGTECAPGRICPSEGITRAVMAVWLGRALTAPGRAQIGQEPQPIEASRFADVEVDGHHAFEAAHVERFADLGVTSGCRSGPLRYCPDAVVTRAQMATFLQRALSLDIPAQPAGFTDVDRDSVHARSIDALRASGITAGCNSDGTRYCPDQPVARGQMATFINRAQPLIDERREALEFEGAVVVGVGSRVAAERVSGGASFFRFEVPAVGASVVVETHGDLDLYASLRRVVSGAPDEDIAFDDDGGVGRNSRIALDYLAPVGWYLVEVFGFSSSAVGDYEISLTVTPFDDRPEALEFEGAVVVGVGSRVAAELAEGGASFFRFEVPAGGASVVVETHGGDLGLDLYASLRRVVSGAPDEDIASDDEGVRGDSRIALDLAAGGWYLVEVRGYAGDYELSVTLG